MFLPYITLTAQIPAALQSHGSHYKPYILWLQADFIQKYPKCCVLPKFTKFHIHLIFPCCPPYIPPLPTARISRMGPFPDQSDAPSWLPGCTFLDRPDVPSRTDWMPLPGLTGCTFPDRPDIPSRTDPMYLPGPTRCTFPNGRMPLPALTGYPTPRRPSSARSQLQPYGCNHFSKKGDCTCGPFRLLYGWIVNNNAAEPQRG